MSNEKIKELKEKLKYYRDIENKMREIIEMAELSDDMYYSFGNGKLDESILNNARKEAIKIEEQIKELEDERNS